MGKISLWGLIIGLALLAGCASNPKTDFSKQNKEVCKSYDPQLALTMGQLSAASYENKLSKRKDAVTKMGFTFDREVQDPDHGTQGFLAYSDEIAVVVLTGTEDVKDLLKDAQVWTQEGRKDPQCDKKVSIHNGFYRALSNIKKDETLFQRLTQLQQQGRKVYFTGHSLGGALATILAYFTSLDHPDIQVTAVYTFGQPHTGTSSFQKCYDARLKNRTFRFVNSDDAIPRIKPTDNYEHVGIPIYFDSKGNIVEEADFSALNSVGSFIDSPFINDHDIRNYLNHLEKNKNKHPFSCQ